MLKTDVDHIAKPALPLIVLGVLKGYINGALWFVLGTALSFRKFTRTIELDLPEDFINSAAFTAWVYIRLKEKVGQEKAFEITRACVLSSGMAVQQANFRNVEAERRFENLVKFQQRTNQEGPTRLNTMEIDEESDSRYTFHVTRCLFHEFYTYLGIPELTSVMCSIDNAIFNSYMPEEVIFHRGGLHQRMADGKPECFFVVERKSE